MAARQNDLLGARRRIVVLTAGGVFAEAMINAVAARFPDVVVVQEDAEAYRQIFRRWLKLRGPFRAAGQIAFGPLQRIMASRARERRREILNRTNLDTTPNPRVTRRHVPHVNDQACREALLELSPKVVLVVGTRMIRKPTLACVPAPFINYHAGINPQYRGQYGGYWAIANGDAGNAGVTVHLIDEGVDTGASLYVARIERTARDNVATDHYLQLEAAVPLVIKALEDALEDRLKPFAPSGPSQQWFHPSVFQYLWTGLRRGVW